MATGSFEISLRSELEALTKKLDLTVSQALAFWFLRRALEISDDEALEAVSVDGANDKGLDFFYLDTENSRVIIGQAKYSSDFKVNTKDAHLNALQTSLNWLN